MITNSMCTARRMYVIPAQLHRRSAHVGLISTADAADFFSAHEVAQPSYVFLS